MSLKASISGIRGIIGSSLTPQVIVNYISAFSSILNKGDILLGRDSRVSGLMVAEIVKGVLNATGRDVVDIGIIPTPVVLFGVSSGTYAGGIIITASHNPEEWNALKFVNSKGKFLSPLEFKSLTEIYEKSRFNYCEFNKIGNVFYNDKIPFNHIEKIIKFIKKELIKKSNFKVALDTVNGGGGPHTINFLKKLGCKVYPINWETTGKFSHNPEPTPVNLKELSAFIKKNKVDIGFAIDPDGDRLVVADENGRILSEELTLAFCIKHYLKNYSKSEIVINTSTSRIIEDIAENYECNVYRVPTGEINVTEKMEKIKAKIGGEGNGGVILPELNKCRDSLVGIALILEMLSMEKNKISNIANDLPGYVFLKEKIHISGKDDLSKDAIDKIKLEFIGQNIDTQDGIRINLKDSWVLIRKSNTEPIVRIFAEAKKEDEALVLINKIKKIINPAL